MIEKFRKISNPLTIIAIFAGLAEVSGTTVLPFLHENIQPTFIWFLIGFPTLLIILFFVTLNFNSRVLYAPADFRNEDNYLKTMAGFKDSKYEITKTEANKHNFDKVRGSIRLATQRLMTQKEQSDVLRKLEKLDFSDNEKKSNERLIVDNANAFFDNLLDISSDYFKNDVLKKIQFGIQSKEFFLLKFKISEQYLKEKNLVNEYSVIINISVDRNGKLNFIAIGKDILDKNPVDFAHKVFHYLKKTVQSCVESKHLE